MKRAVAALVLVAACGRPAHHHAAAPLAADDGLRQAFAAASRSRPVPTTTTMSTTAQPRPAASPRPAPRTSSATGHARVSWYGAESGSRTASGARFDPGGLTFAHRTMRFGTRVRFCHAGRCVVATCTDRGPASWTGRAFDLSRGAFAAIAPLGAGVVDVSWEPVG